MSTPRNLRFLYIVPTAERRRLHLAIGENNYGADVLVAGYGCKGGEPESTGILHIEKNLETGHLTLYIWGDITEEEPTHVIDLELASEEFREEGEDAG